MAVIIFDRFTLARLLSVSVDNVNNHIHRGLVPTLLGDRRRPLTSFDAWMTLITDLACRDGGLDRSHISRAMFNAMDNFLDCARRIDRGGENLAAFFVLRADKKFACFPGPFKKALDNLLAMRPHAIRVTFISLNMAADLVRINAKEQGVEIDKFGMTAEELAALYTSKKER